MKQISLLKSEVNNDEKGKLLDEATATAKKIRLSNQISSLVAKIIYLINAVCSLPFIFSLISEPSEMEALQANIPKFSEQLAFVTKWNTDTLHIIGFFVVFLIIVPIFSSLIVRFIFLFIKIPPYVTSNNIMKEKSKEVYQFIKKQRSCCHNSGSTSLVSIIAGFICIVYLAILFIKLPSPESVVTKVFACIFLGFLVFLASQFLCLFIKPALSFKNEISDLDITTLYNFWLENDPDEQRRREEEEKRYEAKKRAEVEREARKSSLTLHTRGISSANRLTIYVDGKSVKSFNGGIDMTIKLDPGYHTVQVQVYNDASELAYALDPMCQDFEAYETYYVNYS